MKFAWIENSTVRDISPGDPSEYYRPEIAAFYNTQIPDDILRGATKIAGVWTNPAPVEPAPELDTQTITVSPVEFKLLWTPQERVAIKGMRATDPVIDDFYDILDDPRLTLVNLSLVSTQQAVGYLLTKLVAANILQAGAVDGRNSAILSGQFL